jgi:putative transcriptional regulator
VELLEIKKKIAGDMIYEEDFPSALKRWREIFKISQTELAKQLKVSPSVLSDYEKGRRKSPGVKTVVKIIDALVGVDIIRGSPTLNTLSALKAAPKRNGVMKIVEFKDPILVRSFCEQIHAKLIVDLPFSIHGCTIIDAQKAVVEMSAEEFVQFFGEFPERAFIFTNVRSGKPAMVAVKVGRLYAKMLKPRLIVMHKPKRLSKTVVEIAEKEKIALATTNMDLDKIILKIS